MNSYPPHHRAAGVLRIAVATCMGLPGAAHPYRFVLGIIDLTGQAFAPTGWSHTAPQTYQPPMYHNEGAGIHEWSWDNLGSVFGTCLDDTGNIYVTATTCYTDDFFSPVHTSNQPTGGEIYRIHVITGEVSLFAQLPNSGQGLGNITFDPVHGHFFVSNMEDGMIYTLAGNGTVLPFPYDHGLDGRAAEGLSPVPDSQSPGYTPLGRRVWAVEVVRDQGDLGHRLFYSVWREDFGRHDGSGANEIWSVQLDPITGNIMNLTPELELSLPTMPGGNWSNPVSDISFRPNGRMLLAERSMFSDTDPGAHMSRLLEYRRFTTFAGGHVWMRSLDPATGKDIHQVGYFGTSSAGGVDFDFALLGNPLAPSWGRTWITADALAHPFLAVYGVAGMPFSGGNTLNPPATNKCLLIDFDGSYPDTSAKYQQGDVEIPCPSSSIWGFYLPTGPIFQ